MKEQELFQEILKRDSEFFELCKSITYTPENYEKFSTQLYNFRNILKKTLDKKEVSSEFAEKLQAFFNARSYYYNTIKILQDKYRSVWFNPDSTQIQTEQMTCYMSMIRNYTKFILNLEAVLTYPEKMTNLSRVISDLYKIQDWINSAYKALFQVNENLIHYELPGEKREHETEEDYKNYILSYLNRDKQEEYTEEPTTIAEPQVEDSQVVPSVEAESINAGNERKDKDTLNIIDFDDLEKQESDDTLNIIDFDDFEKQESAKVNKSIVSNYLLYLDTSINHYKALKEEVMDSMANDQLLPESKMTQFEEERKNYVICNEERERVNRFTEDELSRLTEKELNLPKDISFPEWIENLKNKKFPPVSEIQLIGNLKNAIKEYENSTGHKVDIKIEELKNGVKNTNIVLPEEKRNPEKPLTEAELMGNLTKAKAMYEEFTGNRMHIKIKQKPKGFSFKTLRKASESSKSKIKEKKNPILVGAIFTALDVVGFKLRNLLDDWLGKYIERTTNPDEMHLNTSTEEILNNMAMNMDVHPREIELPFHINSTMFTLMPGSLVYTDMYLGLDGNDSARRPLYSNDTFRMPERGVLKNPITGEIIMVKSDEEMLHYMENNWEVIGAYSFDGYYKLDSIVVQIERGRSR